MLIQHLGISAQVSFLYGWGDGIELTRTLVKSELDLHVAKGRGMEGCGRGRLSVVVICCGRACELIVFADGIRF